MPDFVQRLMLRTHDAQWGMPKLVRSWHGKEGQREFNPSGRGIGDFETLSSVFEALGVADVDVALGQDFTEVNGTVYPKDTKTLVLMGVPDTGTVVLNRSITEYQPLSNENLFTLLDPLCQQTQLMGAGFLGRQWEIRFVQLMYEPYIVGEQWIKREEDREKERILPFLTLVDNLRQGATFYGNGGVRVVCWNTAQLAMGELPRLNHSATQRDFMSWMTAFQEAAAQAIAEGREALNRLFVRKVNREEINWFIQALYPEPEKSKKLVAYESSIAQLGEEDALALMDANNVADDFRNQKYIYERGMARTEQRREGLANTIVSYRDTGMAPEAIDTAYHLFQAATAHIQHDERDFNLSGIDRNMRLADPGSQMSRLTAQARDLAMFLL